MPVIPGVTGDPNMPQYTDIGHEQYEGRDISSGEAEGLWAIDYEFNIKDVPVTQMNKHENHEYMGLNNYNEYAAKGRYHTANGESKVTLYYLFIHNEKFDYASTRRLEYIAKNVVKKLDQHFSNPEIYQVFDPFESLNW